MLIIESHVRPIICSLANKTKKIAMITIDKKIAEGQRRLGDVPVINYHRIPSRAQLTVNLQDAE
ncbi:hypothetical protein [Psychrobacter sp. JCM 18900]|uniref:hypothetical protein n=1 Tax=Psychrobacter sp. JCM 18900 TaxID=1298608 RepID=UPI0021C42239|nr:hypothetical protein [Psychrobacter sp. JCM 18900]